MDVGNTVSADVAGATEGGVSLEPVGATGTVARSEAAGTPERTGAPVAAAEPEAGDVPETAVEEGRGRPANPVALLLSWSGEKRSWYVASVLLAVIGVAGSIVPYFAVGQMIAGVLAQTRDFAFYLGWCGIAAAGYLIYIICHNASTTLSHKATFATISKVRRRLADKLTRVPMGYVLDTPSGKLKNIMVEKVDSIETTLAHVVPEMTSNLLVPIAVIVFMFTLDWRMALIALVTLPIGFICYMGMMRDYASWYEKTVQAGEEMSAASVEYVGGIEVIKAFGQSASSYEKFSNAVTRYARSFIDWMHHCQIFQDGGLAIWPATLVTVLPAGCFFVMEGTLDPATFVMVAVLSLGIFPPLYAAMNFIDSLAQIGTVVEQITGILDVPEQRRATSPAATDGTRIELENVRFSYGREEVVHGIDLTIEPNSVTAFVGPSGSGKSTLARLIAGFWDASSGAVRIGGVSVNDMPPGQLMDLVSFVEQDNYLFDDTVMENIRMGKPGASDSEVIEVAKQSGCYEFIESLEHGFETVVGGSGGHLSGGERQRIAIARAMLKSAPIVILDEATAYTDPENEAVVEAAVGKLVAGKTLIVIAHRLSTITDADSIVVVADGRIEAQGTHGELLAACPLYAHMYEAHIDAKDAA